MNQITSGRTLVARVAYPAAVIEGTDLQNTVIRVQSPSEPPWGSQNPEWPRTFTNPLYLPVPQLGANVLQGCVVTGAMALRRVPALRYIYDGCPFEDWRSNPARGTWVVRGDFATGDVALFSLSRDHFAATGAYRVALLDEAGRSPDLASAALAVFPTAPEPLGLPAGDHLAFFALDRQISDSGVAGYSLWVGGISGTDSPWRQHAAGAPVASNVTLDRPRLIGDPEGGRLLLVADAEHTLGVSAGFAVAASRAHPVYALDLASGTWADLGSLGLPEGLTDHAVVMDPRSRSVFVVGGAVVGHGLNPVRYHVSLADLRVTALPGTLAEGARREDADAALVAQSGELLLAGGTRGGLPLTDVWAMDPLSGQARRIATEVPGARSGFVAADPTGARLFFWGEAEGATDASIRLVAVDSQTGVSTPIVALDETPTDPGLIRGQVRDGVAQIFPMAIPAGVPYPGALWVATLAADGPGLILRVIDSRGVRLATSRSEAAGRVVAWLGQPGEQYTVAVGPGESYAAGQVIGFTVFMGEGGASDLGGYTGSWPVAGVSLAGALAVLHGSRGVQVVGLADPAAPSLLSRKVVPGLVQSAELYGDRVCLARLHHPRGLRCLVIEYPEDPHWEGPGARTTGWARDLAVRGEIGYVAEGFAGVGIYDLLAGPAKDRPVEVGFVPVDGLALAVHVHGDRLFVTTWDGVVKIYGLSVPTEPAYLGEIDGGGPVVGFLTQGRTVHLQRLAPDWAPMCLLGIDCPLGDVVEVFDVADPLVPLKVGEYQASESLPWVTARFSGDRLVVPEARGFRVLGVEPLEGTP